MIETIKNGETTIAIIVSNNFDKEGIEFVTPNEFSQQLAYMHHPCGHSIIPHFHNKVSRTVHYTQEVLLIKKGKMRVNFYDDECKYLENRILSTGDIILLSAGGHGFEMLEETILIEIKQGPYVGEADKSRFTPKE